MCILPDDGQKAETHKEYKMSNVEKLDLIAKMLDEMKNDMEPTPMMHADIVRAYKAVIKALEHEHKGK
jgi:hypothetical protein